MTRWVRAAVLGLCLLAGCCSPKCLPDQLPRKGVVRTSKELFKLVQYAGKHECWEVVYDVTSKRTRDEHGYLKFWLFLKHFETPEPWGYRLVDVIRGGEFVGALPNLTDPKQKLVIVTYQEAPKPELLAQILVVREKDDDGKFTWRMALEEQNQGGPPLNQEPPQAGRE